MNLRSRQHLESKARAGAGWVPAGDNRIIARVLGELKLVLDPRDFSLTPHLAMDGFWESWITVWFANNLDKSDHLLNVGANCGYYAALAATQVERVVAVEPQRTLAANIKLSASLNGLDNLEVRCCVAGELPREVELRCHPEYWGSAFIGDDGYPGFTESTLVHEYRASDLGHTATVAFIDAEGYEPAIWAGLKSLLDERQLRWVALEWAPTRYADPKAFLESLAEYGPLSVINDKGGEQPAPSTNALLSGSDWETLVVRRAD